MHRQRLAFVFLLCFVTGITPGCAKRKSVATAPKQASTNPYQAGNTPNLSEYIRTVLKITQENTAATQEALKLLHEKRPDVAALAKLIEKSAKDTESRHLLAAVYMQEKLYSPAFQLYQEIKAVSPEDGEAELALAKIWNLWGDNALARQHAESAVRLSPQAAEGFDLLGRIHLSQNELDQAISAFLSGVNLEPENALLHANVGYAFFARGDLHPARLYLQKAVHLDDTLAEAQNNLGVVLGNLGDFDGALKAFQAANGKAEALNNLGVVYLSQRRWREAIVAFRQALSISPGYSKARTNLTEAEARIPRPTVIDLPSFGNDNNVISVGPTGNSSITAASQPGDRERDGIQIIAGSGRFIARGKHVESEGKHSRYAAAYRDAINRFRTRRYTEAVDIFRWLLQQGPDPTMTGNCEYWIGECLFGMGKYEKAKAAFTRVLAGNSDWKKGDAQKMLKRIQQISRQEKNPRGKKAI